MIELIKRNCGWNWVAREEIGKRKCKKRFFLTCKMFVESIYPSIVYVADNFLDDFFDYISNCFHRVPLFFASCSQVRAAVNRLMFSSWKQSSKLESLTTILFGKLFIHELFIQLLTFSMKLNFLFVSFK